MTGGCIGVPPNALLRCALPISGSQHDFKLIEFIPLGFGALSVGDRQKLLQASTGGDRSWFIHGGIISSFGRDSLAMCVRLARLPYGKINRYFT